MTDNATNNLPFSESDAFQEILNWSEDRPEWQRDALRRIVQSEELSENDIVALEKICIDKNENSEPLKPEHLATQAKANTPTSLAAVREPTGVNALASDQTLSFQGNGLNIVYGDNGSGKSGYVRILKNACRSRDGNFSILPDINGNAHVDQKATIAYHNGEETVDCEWRPNDCDDDKLPLISIFDARSANTHVQSENNVAYTPYPMQILQTLVGRADQLKSRIDQRIADIEDQTPNSITDNDLALDSPAGAFLATLSAKSDLGILETLVTLSDDGKKRLATLEVDLAQDPAKAAAKLKATKSRLTDNAAKLASLTKATSEASANNIADLRANHANLTEVSKLASEELFSSSPLPEIGGESWRALWEAARKYSDTVAYPDTEFPQVDADSDLCVLCQQPLSEEAVERRMSFEAFIKSTAKSDELKAKQALDTEINNLKSVQQDDQYIANFEALLRDELDDEKLAETVKKCYVAANFRMQSILENSEITQEALPIPQSDLDAIVSELDKRITELSAENEGEARKAILKEHRDLRDRDKLGGMRADVAAQIGRLIEIDKLKAALKTTSKRPITNKNKELSDKLVTDALRGRFAREVEKLKIGAMPLELKKVRDSYGESIFQVEFVGLSGKPVGEVLSEGEHRCVALAAFLAELVTSQSYSAIVFDDPMSSLDHLYRKKVAKRLVEEAAHRQVVVFTHDLSFLFELKREAEANETQLHFQHVRRRNNQPGHIGEDLPMKAKQAAAMAHAIEKDLKDIKGSFDNLSETRRTAYTKGILEQLREGWDQAIADFIHPVLARFDSQIKGSSLYKLLDLTDQDVETITGARKRISEKLHTASEAENANDVSHDDLCKEVKELLGWLEEFKKRPGKKAQPKISVL